MGQAHSIVFVRVIQGSSHMEIILKRIIFVDLIQTDIATFWKLGVIPQKMKLSSGCLIYVQLT